MVIFFRWKSMHLSRLFFRSLSCSTYWRIMIVFLNSSIIWQQWKAKSRQWVPFRHTWWNLLAGRDKAPSGHFYHRARRSIEQTERPRSRLLRPAGSLIARPRSPGPLAQPPAPTPPLPNCTLHSWYVPVVQAIWGAGVEGVMGLLGQLGFRTELWVSEI